MRVREPRPGQIGDQWLSKKPGRSRPNDPWCRTWYDKEKRQTCRESLGTADNVEASRRLAAWISLNERPKNAQQENILIEQLILFYWNDWGKNCPSAYSIQYELAAWQKWWEGKSVAEITPESLRLFREYLASGGRKKSTVDKYLTTGKAALNYAVEHGMLNIAPRIHMLETSEEKEARPPLGRPLNIDEMAVFIDAIRQPHLLTFTMILANTMARTSAILELTRSQYDADRYTVALNREGRVQTKKRRPTLLVPPNLRPWLDQPMAPTDRYITWGGAPVGDIKTAWSVSLKRSGLTGKVNRYSFRHGMARQLRLRGIHLDEIGMGLGHKHKGANATTAIYVPDDPAHLEEWAKAIEGVMHDIKERLKVVNIDNPKDATETLAKIGEPRRFFPKAPRAELDALILAGEKTRDIANRFGVSLTVIYRRQRKLGLK
jgi:integrase